MKKLNPLKGLKARIVAQEEVNSFRKDLKKASSDIFQKSKRRQGWAWQQIRRNEMGIEETSRNNTVVYVALVTTLLILGIMLLNH